MSVNSFSANRLKKLLAELEYENLGLDALRDIQKITREIHEQIADENKKVLAYVIHRKCLQLFDKYDADPLTEIEAQALFKNIKGIISDSIRHLTLDELESDKAISLAASVIGI